MARDSLLKQIRNASGLNALTKGPQGPMIPVNQPGMIPVSHPGMVPVNQGSNAVAVRGGPMVGVRSGMVSVNTAPSQVGVRMPNMVGVNQAPAIPVANGEQMIAVTPGTGQVPVVDTMMYPNNNNVPRTWNQVFMGPGQPFAGLVMTGTREDDAETEPRTMQYLPNVNSTIAPRIAWGLTPFSELRSYAENVPEAAMCIRLLTEELKAFIPTLVDNESKSEVKPAELQWMTETPDRVSPWPVWLSRFLYNVIVYDAPAVYKMRADNPNKNIFGKLFGSRKKRMRKTELLADGTMVWYCPNCGNGNEFSLHKANLSDEVNLPTYCAKCGEDAPASALQKMGLIERERDLEKDFQDNQIIGLRVIDGSTIFCLIDERGEQPDPPAPAFTQVIWGTPRMYLNKHQLWYRPRHLRADAPYGRSFIEDSLPAVKTLASLWDYEFEKYQVGNIPELALTAPVDWTSTEQILEFESAYNSRMSGNNRERVRARFFPAGTTVLQTKEMTFNQDTYSAATNTVRMAAGIPKSEAGEAPEGMMGGKGFAEAMQSAFYRMGLSPLQTFIEGLFNEILKENGYTNLRFVLKFPSDTLDPEKEESKWQGRFVQGLARRDEARTGLAMPALGGDEGKLLITPGQKGGDEQGGEGADGQNGAPGGPGGQGGGGNPFAGLMPGGAGPKPAGGLPGGSPALPKKIGVNFKPKKLGVKPPPKLSVKMEKVDFDPSEFAMGMKEEQEHAETVDGNEEKIKQIVLDHLAEDRFYYSHLEASHVGEETSVPVAKLAKSEKRPAQTGVMVALEMPPAVAQKLTDCGITWPEGAEPEPAEELHVTLAYPGDISDMKMSEADLNAMVERFAETCPPITGSINGVTRFLETHKDGMHAIVANFDAPDLAEIRQGLVRFLAANGLEWNDSHGFTPHITLAYIPADAPTPELCDFKVIGDVTVPMLTVAWGGHATGHLCEGRNMNAVKVMLTFGLQKNNGVSPEEDQYFGAPVTQVVNAEMPHQGANTSLIVSIGGGELAGAPAVWKPVSGEKPSLVDWIGGALYKRSECAYLLDREIAPDEDRNLVPVTYLDNVDGEAGSVQLFVKGARPRQDVSTYDEKWIAQAAVLDYVMGQVDRVSKNWLTHPDDYRRPVLIDNDLSFSPKDEDIRSDFLFAMSEKPVSQELLDSLFLAIGNRDLWEDIAENLGDEEAAAKARERARSLYKEGAFPKHPMLLVKDGEGAVAAPDAGFTADDVPGVYFVGASGSSVSPAEGGEDHNPKDKPRMIKVFWTVKSIQEDLAKVTWDESKHPRGHEGNAGEFAPKGEGGEAVAEKPRDAHGAGAGRYKMKRAPAQSPVAPADAGPAYAFESHPGFTRNSNFKPPDNYILVMHVTKNPSVKSIMDNGLIPGKNSKESAWGAVSAHDNDNVWFWRDSEDNPKFANWDSKKEAVIVAAVPNTVWKDPEGSHASMYKGTIPKEWIYGVIQAPKAGKRPAAPTAEEPKAEAKPEGRDFDTVKSELTQSWNMVKRGATQDVHDKFHALRKEIIGIARANYEADHEPINEFGEHPQAGDAMKTFILPWELDYYGRGEPAWATKARNAYVVNDPRTLKNNMALRNGEDVSSNWVQNTDRLCETGHFSEDSLLYRGAAMRMDQIDAMLKNGGFLDPAYMSTSPERDTAEIYADIRIRENPTAASQKVIFTLKVPANGPTFGRMDNSEYVLARGGKISITGVRRPTADKEQWEIFGEVS